jgi:hypothetical protein
MDEMLAHRHLVQAYGAYVVVLVDRTTALQAGELVADSLDHVETRPEAFFDGVPVT